MKIAPFRIEQYYAVHEFTAPYMLSSSGGKPTDADQAQALVDGSHVAWIGCAAFLAAGAVLLFVLLRRGDVLAAAHGEAEPVVT